jgi:ADP-ribose pyrophosphatase
LICKLCHKPVLISNAAPAMIDFIYMAKSKLIYKSRNFDFINVTEKLPNGNTASIDMIRHPGAAVIVPFLTKDKVVIIWQYRQAIQKYIYEFPAGTLEKDEDPKLCAYRELIEETGYKASKMTFLGDVIPVPGYSSEVLKIYSAHGLKPVGAKTEDSEVIETKVFSKMQVLAMFRSGQITDGKTIAALAMIGWV